MKNLIILKINFFCPKKINNSIPLVLSFEEISLQPELSSLPRFRNQGGSPEHDAGGRTDRRMKDGNCHV